MLRLMCEHVIVYFGFDDGGNMFLETTACAVRRECGGEVLCEVCSGDGGWACC